MGASFKTTKLGSAVGSLDMMIQALPKREANTNKITHSKRVFSIDKFYHEWGKRVEDSLQPLRLFLECSGPLFC